MAMTAIGNLFRTLDIIGTTINNFFKFLIFGNYLHQNLSFQ